MLLREIPMTSWFITNMKFLSIFSQHSLSLSLNWKHFILFQEHGIGNPSTPPYTPFLFFYMIFKKPYGFGFRTKLCSYWNFINLIIILKHFINFVVILVSPLPTLSFPFALPCNQNRIHTWLFDICSFSSVR